MALKKAPLKVLCAVVPREKVNMANEVLDELGSCANYTILGQKINYSKFANMMGITNFECVMLICIVPTEVSRNILRGFSEKMKLLEIGGVAFLISLSAISRNALNGCLDFYDQNQEILEERKEEIDAIMQGSEEV